MQGNSVYSAEIESNNYSVARIRKQFDQRGSYFGSMLTNKFSIESNNYNTSVGLDGLYWISGLLNLRTWAATNYTNNQSGLENLSYGLRLSRFPASGYRFDLRYRDFRSSFDPALGFLARPNTKRLTINNGFGVQFENHNWLSSITAGGYLTHYWVSSNGKMQFFQVNTYTYIDAANGYSFRAFAPMYQIDQLFSDWEFSDNITIPADLYKMWKWEPRISTGDAFRYSFVLDATIGDFFGGQQTSLRPSASYIINRHLNVELGTSFNKIRFPNRYSSEGVAVDRQILYTGRINYAFNTNSTLKTFIQYDNSSKLFGSNIRFRYNPKEGVNLYLIVNNNMNIRRNRHQMDKPLVQSQGVILKYSHTIN